jgi:hypothetical protein
MSVRVLAAEFARAVLDTRPSKNSRGRRECRVKASPAAPVHNKKHGEGTTGSAGSSGIPCAMVYGLYRALPGDRALLPPSRARSSCALDTSVGVSGPHDFTVRADDARPASSSRPSHPRLTCRDDRDTPSASRRDAADQIIYFRKTEYEYFSRRGLTMESVEMGIESAHEFRFSAHAILWRLTPSRDPPFVKTRTIRPSGVAGGSTLLQVKDGTQGHGSVRRPLRADMPIDHARVRPGANFRK